MKEELEGILELVSGAISIIEAWNAGERNSLGEAFEKLCRVEKELKRLLERVKARKVQELDNITHIQTR